MAEDYRRMNAARADPFPIVKEKVQTAVRQLEGDMMTWKDLLKRTNTYTNQQFQRTHKSVKKQLRSLNSNLKALSQTVKAVESQRARFENIDDYELTQRRNFVSETTVVVDTYQKLISDPATKKKRADDQRKVEDLRAEPTGGPSYSSKSQPLARQMQEQEDLEEQQDEVLDDMQTVLGRLGVAADNIELELGEHKELLQELDKEIETAQGRMGVAMKKLQKLLGTSSNSKICCLFMMFFMVIILLGLAVFA
eukprot:jgi/Bigna1/87364/estExt_fgenesh1_pg.C_190171